ncbi:MAG: aldo/keto reductase, partial [Rhizobiaceae bacterium]|nr:aldo/keto reductase [Rhizobiaceae bacterium]
CKTHSVELPAAALQFPLAHPAVACVIPGARSAEEFTGILNWAKADIPAEFWNDLQSKGLLHKDAPLPTENPFK